VEELSIDVAAVTEELVLFISSETLRLNRDGAVVGLSGGIDSAVVAALATRALGPEKVLSLIMPELDSAPESRRYALTLAKQLGTRCKVVGLSTMLALMGVYRKVPLWLLGLRRLKAKMVRRYWEEFGQELDEGETPFSAVMMGTKGLRGPWLNKAVAYHRVKVRLRMLLLYYYAELNNLLVLGTCNKTEKMIGFFVKYGDAAADASPLEGLYKTQVRELATFLSIPEEIVVRPPSPDLLPGITDEYAIGLAYETLDRILWRLEKGMERERIADDLGVDLSLVGYVDRLTERSEHMRFAPPSPATGPS